jgi:superfamily I DNA/RNA helicase
MRSDRPVLETFVSKDFQKFLRKLSRNGGIGDVVYKQVMRALVFWEESRDPQIPLTNRGESRIPHVVKYDLRDAFRLVVYEHAGKRIPLMVGDHEDAERWLESHRGQDFTIDMGSKKIEFTIASTDKEATEAATADVEAVPAAKGPILARLPQEIIAALELSQGTLDSLNAFATFEEVEDSRIWTLIQGLAFPTEEHRQLVTQAVALVAMGDADKAIATITLFLGNATTATESPDDFAAAIDGDENSDKLIRLSDITVEELDRINQTDGFTDWMLYLHPDQRRLVDRDYNGPARLIGVSGSGKTTVLVHRANALAKKYPDGEILVLTLNPPLAKLIGHLLSCLCTHAVRQRIKVTTVYQYCYQAVKTIAPNDLIERNDPRSGEDLETCWTDFLDKPHAATSILKVMNVLEAREANIDAARYILDELIWIRSGFGRAERNQYLISDRTGRGIALPRYEGPDEKQRANGDDFPADTRLRILRLLEDYEEYMKAGGLMDEDGVSLEAYSVKHRINEFLCLRARCVLVDEVQDCSTVELAVLAEIPSGQENGLFLTGDPVQKVFAKQHELAQAGIDIRGRGALLRVNYRNTRQILKAAYTTIDKYRDIAPIAANEVLEPEYAVKEGPKPKIYECASHAEQLLLVTSYLGWMTPDEHDGVCICSASEDSLTEFSAAVQQAGMPVYRINSRAEVDPTISRGVKVCLMRDIKGFEFQYVFLVDVVDSVVYPKGMPWDERWRVAFQVYVAMTRARKELVITFINNRSYFLGPIQDTADDLLASTVLT